MGNKWKVIRGLINFIALLTIHKILKLRYLGDCIIMHQTYSGDVCKNNTSSLEDCQSSSKCSIWVMAVH